MNIISIIENIEKVVKSHEIETGKYQRWLWQNETCTRDLGINEYGCADAANILYTIGKFPSEPAEREKWVNALCSLQDEETGLFREPTHHFIHTTAHCTAAIELFDQKPRYPFKALEKYKTPEGLYELLEEVDWINDPWPCSHRGAGIYAAFVINGDASQEWIKAYFDWFRNECDPKTGLWRKGYIDKSTLPHYPHMGGSFHYMFNHEHAKMPHPYPDKLIDTCINMYRERAFMPTFARQFNFIEADWVYCINRATRQTPYRFYEAKEEIRKFAAELIEYLNEVDWDTDDGANDLHMLFGVVCCLAELQAALPGEIETDVPLKLVLDRRPFI